jgi:hypothetical protein
VGGGGRINYILVVITLLLGVVGEAKGRRFKTLFPTNIALGGRASYLLAVVGFAGARGGRGETPGKELTGEET